MANQIKRINGVSLANIKSFLGLQDANIKNINGLEFTQYVPDGFATQWTVSGDATARTITLPLVETRSEGALSYNCTIDWGDGTATSTVTAFDDADRIHTYALDGTYNVEITGTCEGWSFNNTGDKLKITKVISFGDANFDGFKYLKGGFYGCTNLTSLGTNSIKASGTGVLTDGFERLFSGCANLVSLTTGLFDNHTAISTNAFFSAFHTCTSLTSIPTDLFKYNTLVSTNGFYFTFYNCSSITSIPIDLFKYNTLVSTSGFNNTFRLTSIITIPTDLFRYNTLVSTSGFTSTFQDCALLTTIPTDLFRYNTLVSTSGFRFTFDGCASLETVPEYLFRYNIAVSSLGFQSTFDGCVKLQLNSNIFCDEATEKTTRFNNQSPNFTSCFNISSFTGTQGTAPALWDYTYGTGTPVTTDCFTGHDGTSLDNYADIPTAWGGA